MAVLFFNLLNAKSFSFFESVTGSLRHNITLKYLSLMFENKYSLMVYSAQRLWKKADIIEQFHLISAIGNYTLDEMMQNSDTNMTDTETLEEKYWQRERYRHKGTRHYYNIEPRLCCQILSLGRTQMKAGYFRARPSRKGICKFIRGTKC